MGARPHCRVAAKSNDVSAQLPVFHFFVPRQRSRASTTTPAKCRCPATCSDVSAMARQYWHVHGTSPRTRSAISSRRTHSYVFQSMGRRNYDARMGLHVTSTLRGTSSRDYQGPGQAGTFRTHHHRPDREFMNLQHTLTAPRREIPAACGRNEGAARLTRRNQDREIEVRSPQSIRCIVDGAAR